MKRTQTFAHKFPFLPFVPHCSAASAPAEAPAAQGGGGCDMSLLQNPLTVSLMSNMPKNKHMKYNTLNISVSEYFKQICS